VGNLSFNIDEDTLREAFASCGEIASIRFAEDRETGAFKGFGHIEFVESESTDKAVAMAGEDVMGRAVRVDYANDRRGGGGGGGGGGRGRGYMGGELQFALLKFNQNRIDISQLLANVINVTHRRRTWR